LISNNRIILLFSQELIDEFVEVALRPKFRKYFSSTDLQNLLIKIRVKAAFVTVHSVVNACRDPKDNFLLALARDAKATHLLTGDNDLLALKRFEKTRILSIMQYLSITNTM
jgi:putative PIN family toxin of toxin-antitoxin system